MASIKCCVFILSNQPYRAISLLNHLFIEPNVGSTLYRISLTRMLNFISFGDSYLFFVAFLITCFLVVLLIKYHHSPCFCIICQLVGFTWQPVEVKYAGSGEVMMVCLTLDNKYLAKANWMSIFLRQLKQTAMKAVGNKLGFCIK